VNGWTVELRPRAKKELRILDDGPRQEALDLLDELREEGPALVAALKMRGYPDTWRVRFYREGYRMVYTVFRSRKHIVVTRIRPRPIAYKGMRH
jgi:mRNA-degrading endonuclease RelE of RelBE toxin-antitoxin system